MTKDELKPKKKQQIRCSKGQEEPLIFCIDKTIVDVEDKEVHFCTKEHEYFALPVKMMDDALTLYEWYKRREKEEKSQSVKKENPSHA